MASESRSRPDYTKQESLLPQSVPRDFSDHVFATKHGISLALRLWPAPKSSPSTPWILWTHGGAYCAGAHYAPPSWVLPALRGIAVHVITCAYRLGPQAGFEEMVEDCVDAFKWCRLHLASSLDGNVDIEAFGVEGDSAGGSLSTLLSSLSTLLGHVLDPRPGVVVDIYGPVDFLTMPPITLPVPALIPIGFTGTGQYPESALIDAVKDRDPKNTIIAAPFTYELANIPEATTQHRWAVDASTFSYSERVRFQTELKTYMGDAKLTMRTALRLDDYPTKEAQEERAKAWSSLHLLDRAKGYPPTVVLHGTGDKAVPVEQSQRFAERLKGMGVVVRESYEEGAPHGFDQAYTVRRPPTSFVV